VAMFTPDPANPTGAALVYYIHTDHLDAPRIVVDRNNQTRWRWLSEPFGTTAPETNPQGLGDFTQNLRFPGQYADAESGLWYNHHRYYGVAEGRYTQSDPIGLNGGINTYSYTMGNPLRWTDPTGKIAIADDIVVGSVIIVGCALMPVCRQAVADAAKAAGRVCEAGADRLRNWVFSDGVSNGDKDPSTPTGQRGSPMDVPKGSNEPATIDGRDYSGHALDQMQGRGIPPAAVDDAIRNGNSRPDKIFPDTRTEHTSPDGRVVVITDTGSGRVVTVITR